jgi:hypothetical protein
VADIEDGIGGQDIRGEEAAQAHHQPDSGHQST